MVLRFYRGGPVAVRGRLFWVSADGLGGCCLASKVGANIPTNAYFRADPAVSQGWYGRVGVNDTALLPIEE